MKETPCVNDGKQPVLMELLSPGFKPVQLTQDLGSFWKDTYFEVRKELKRRYPKHFWPENPLESEAVNGVKRYDYLFTLFLNFPSRSFYFLPFYPFTFNNI